MLTQLDAKGGKTCFSYDKLNRLTGKRYDGDATCPTPFTEEYAYDQAGHEVEVNQCPPWEIRGKTGMYQLFEVVGTKANSAGLA